MTIRFTAMDRVTHQEDRLREARFWSTRTMAERVIAGWALAEDDLMRREDHEPEDGAGIILRRVSRSGR